MGQKLLANSGEVQYGWNDMTFLTFLWMLGASFGGKVGAYFISGMIPVCLNCFQPVTLGFRSGWRWEDRGPTINVESSHSLTKAWRVCAGCRSGCKYGIVFGRCGTAMVEIVVWGMEQVVLSPPKPRGSSLVSLHMTWLSHFESISSSTLAVWTLAKEAESWRGHRSRS